MTAVASVGTVGRLGDGRRNLKVHFCSCPCGKFPTRSALMLKIYQESRITRLVTSSSKSLFRPITALGVAHMHWAAGMVDCVKVLSLDQNFVKSSSCDWKI
jgi:hypothetical protein